MPKKKSPNFEKDINLKIPEAPWTPKQDNHKETQAQAYHNIRKLKTKKLLKLSREKDAFPIGDQQFKNCRFPIRNHGKQKKVAKYF